MALIRHLNFLQQAGTASVEVEQPWLRSALGGRIGAADYQRRIAQPGCSQQLAAAARRQCSSKEQH
eukprot:CAMPEP_0178453268 /NCGR_PEP_ID=MMETSP0689_2-20121128/44719_1 /TAXON_ID=160604 /ORGANISM="Amphidinium massartii, Strain CS-259" /LENGTH=65 /DNA_ID=CAMNT_0020079093 /DNA_START=1482 /DNA_END=1679 /DNA_ORIENTATION=-